MVVAIFNKNTMRDGCWFCAVTVVVVILGLLMVDSGVAGAEGLEKECADNFQKLTDCLGFATGKGAVPTKTCCTSVTEIRNTKPVCLCYIIQQMHSGSNPQLKSLGIQEAKLLELPSACKLANSSTAECPKLLKLPANSPDAAIFADPSPSTATPAAPKGTSSPAVSATTDNKSAGGMKLQIPVPHLIIGTFMSIFTANVFFLYA